MKAVYDLAYFCFAAVYLPFFIIKSGQAEDRMQLIRQRLGLFDRRWKEHLLGKRVVWVHAVSVGEVMAVENFIQMFLDACPGLHVVLTTVTPTGQRVANKLKSKRVSVCYFPFDFSFSVRSFYRVLQPECVMLAETEVWPNLIAAASDFNVPIGILNGRLSEKSCRNYSKLPAVFNAIFRQLDFVLAQSSEDADRFSRVGVDEDKIQVLGNMKYDNAFGSGVSEEDAAIMKADWGFADECRIWIAGSTHPGEEEMVARIFYELKEKHPSLALIIAPRHIERAQKIRKKIESMGLEARLASEQKTDGAANLLILDKLGVLKNLYAMSDIVYVGGSLVPRGGQNPIEPAAYRRAIIHGPKTENFRFVYNSLDEEGGAVLVHDQNELKFAVERLLESQNEVRELGNNAYETIASFRGATRKHVEWLREQLNSEFTVTLKG